MREMTFVKLSKSRQALIRLCQRVNFGAIRRVPIVNGEVDLDSSELLVTYQLEREVTERPELFLCDFELPAETGRLLAQIDAVKNGVIDEIVVHAGVPKKLVLRRHPLRDGK